MVSALEAPDTRGRRKTQASKSTWKSHKDCYVPIRMLWLWSVTPLHWPKKIARMIFMKSVSANVNDRTYICEGWWKKQTSSHGGCKLAQRTWQCSHKNLGKVEREMVRETHKTVRGCCKSDLVFNLRFDKYQEQENFNVFRRMSWTGQVGETCWRMIKRPSGKNLLEFFVFLVAIVP